MSLFRIRTLVCKDLEIVMNSYWWGWDKQKKKTQEYLWAKWERICTPKKQGGLRFKRLKHFNIGMSAKQVWHLLINPKSLAAQTIKAMYHPNSSILQASLGNHHSFIWRSLSSTINLINLGAQIRVRTDVVPTSGLPPLEGLRNG